MKRRGRRHAIAMLDVATIEALLRLRDKLAPALKLAEKQAATWYTVRELAGRLRVTPKTVRRILGPYREKCHLAREGRHPRRVLWIPPSVVNAIEKDRARNPVKPPSPSPLT